jgi:alpha-L-fucosidase
LWPSREASVTWNFPWNAVEAGPKRDLLGDLFSAVRKTSVHAGIYYSLYEWFNPLWRFDRKRYVDEHMWPQMKDVISKYQPDVFWTDGEWEGSDTLWRSKEFLTWLYNESPVKDKIAVNDRWGKDIRFHHAGFFTPEYQPDMDFDNHYFEESRGMGFSYGYNREEDAWDYNSAKVLVLHLIDKVSRGGNFLLDIGPDSHGKIPPIMQERLLQIGKWLEKNGEAIYGSNRWMRPVQWSEGKRDYKPKTDDWKTGGDVMLKLTEDPDPGYAIKEIFFTKKASLLYAIVPKWPTNRKIMIREMNLSGSKISLLETGQPLSFTSRGKNVEISLPAFDPTKMKTDLPFVIRIDGVR